MFQIYFYTVAIISQSIVMFLRVWLHLCNDVHQNLIAVMFIWFLLHWYIHWYWLICLQGCSARELKLNSPAGSQELPWHRCSCREISYLIDLDLERCWFDGCFRHAYFSFCPWWLASLPALNNCARLGLGEFWHILSFVQNCLFAQIGPGATFKDCIDTFHPG